MSILSFLPSRQAPNATAPRRAAPGALRKRVLAGVRGEPMPRHRSPIASVTPTAVILIAVTLLVLDSPLEHGGQPPRHAQRAAGAHANLHSSGRRSELEVSGLAEPPIGEVYEVWLQRAGRSPEPTDALFTVTRAGDATVEVPGGLRGVREVLITAEPLGGSTLPTSAPVLSVQVAS